MTRVYITQDESSHWYIIPFDLQEEFERLCYDQKFEVEFDDKFNSYRTGGDINMIPIYVKPEDLETL